MYLTLGSVAPAMGYFPALYRAAIDALADLPVRLLVTTGKTADPADLGAAPGQRPRRALGAAGAGHARAPPPWSATAASAPSAPALAAGVPLAVRPLPTVDTAAEILRELAGG